MAYWIHGITEDEKSLLWGALGADLIAEDLEKNPRELSPEEAQDLGLALTTKYQEEKGLDYDFSELVIKYGTSEMKESYKAFTEAN